ncbi:translocation and assembly module lipoprotein TamL [Arsenicibacter rosenii]|uniref:Bacterial surface antigen (D15) domain-containing protein n=1 Tax=Arsenicibacter rosenii TaxID=1750698 RepID=A0A1S2VKZ7_9BACT|nr:BamA/TamA family outer membrane protein [Arsenicibacter rosenii]OIN58895.1 hypothetical protein BLX24_11750 [Arsenicibacter rosenii]
MRIPALNSIIRSFISGGLLISLYACNIAKHLPANERLYVGTDISIKAHPSVSKDEQKALKTGLEDLARPRPNKTLFGYPYKVGLYYLPGEPRSENGFRAWFRKKLGEPPVFASSKAINSNAIVWAAYLENEGYFRSSATGELKESGYKAKGVYTATIQPRYYIDSVTFLVDSSDARKALYSGSPRTVLKKGDPYRFENIKVERERINQNMKNRGFFYFQPDYISLLADTARNNHKVRLYVAIKPDISAAALQQYYIRNLYVYTNFSLDKLSRNDTNRTQAYIARGDTSLRQVYIVDSARLYKPQLFNDILGLKPGRRFNSRGQDITLSRFINVGAFKFVRNRFEPLYERDTAFLDVHYYLTPHPKRSVKLELDGITRSNGLSGSQLTLGWLNRNFFGRSEQLSINGTAGTDFQLGGNAALSRNFRFGGNISLTFPRLVSPLNFHYDRRQLLPKTVFTVGAERIIQGSAGVADIPDSVRKGRFYSINSLNTSFGYSWRKNQQIEQTFTPFSINYVYLNPNNDLFLPLLVDTLTRPRYENLYFNTDQFILSTLYSVAYNSPLRSNSKSTYRIQFTAETAGNLASLLIKADEYDTKRILNNTFSQYIRADLDLRYYYKLSPKITWASRFFAGVGNPYGNSTIMPITKQYFVGGSNSLRGFRARAIGPGPAARDTTGKVPFFFDGGGDMKLEANTELRTKFTQYLHGALFVDAGNVWMLKEQVLNGKGSIFSKDFHKQIAVSSGIGLRVDLSYFLIRADVGIPLRKPYQTNGKYWLFGQMDFGDPYWRRQNLILNIAVGYPF